MFFHDKRLQYHAKPERPDPLYAKKLQEVLGGQWGEMSVTTAESQGRLQVCRLYEMTNDRGVRDMLSFLIARDTMHQNQWIAAIADLEADGLETTPCPSAFPRELERAQNDYEFWNCSAGVESGQGRWSAGTAPDGTGQFTYLENPQPLAMAPEPPPPADPKLWGTPKARDGSGAATVAASAKRAGGR